MKGGNSTGNGGNGGNCTGDLSCHVRSDVTLTSGLRSPHEADESVGSITPLRLV